MRRLRTYGSRILVLAFALLTIGPAQKNPSPYTHASGISVGHRIHAPRVWAVGGDGRLLQGPRRVSGSYNWSGYALGTGPTGNYTSASFSWIVQSATYVDYGSGNPYPFNDSSQWVGIGGNVTFDLIQLGSDSYVDNTGTPTYTVWYEMLPMDSINLSDCTPAALSSCPVGAGDVMAASLECTANCTPDTPNTRWSLSMTNSTKGWSWTNNFTYNSSLSSAEWIEEAPTYDEIAAISNFGTASFSNLLVNGTSPNLNAAADGIALLDPEGGYATPCQAFDGNQVGNGNQFVVAYGQQCTTTFDSHDYNADGRGDIGWRNASGSTALWLMNGAQALSSGSIGTVSTTWSIVGQRDFNADGHVDLLWRDAAGDTAIWFMNGTQVSSSQSVGSIGTDWTVVGTSDFNGDGRGDILWEDMNGNLAVWLMNGATVIGSAGIGNVPPSVWTVAAIGDFNGDGMSDILWRDTGGDTSIWFMNDATVSSSAGIGNIPIIWSVVGTGNFNSDGKSDIVWRDSSGNTSIWLMNGATVSSAGSLGNIPTTWSLEMVGDYNGDGKSDLLWRDGAGDTSIWFMNGTTVASTADVGNISTSWTLQSLKAE
jgi:hypothetical protein